MSEKNKDLLADLIVILLGIGAIIALVLLALQEGD